MGLIPKILWLSRHQIKNVERLIGIGIYGWKSKGVAMGGEVSCQLVKESTNTRICLWKEAYKKLNLIQLRNAQLMGVIFLCNCVYPHVEGC